MQGRGAPGGDRSAVCRAGIAFVLFPAVLGVLFGELLHQAVALGFGQDGGGGDAGVGRVAFDDAAVRDVVPAAEAVAVYQQQVGAGGESGDALLHRFHRGPEDVDPVDAFGPDVGDGPGDGSVLDILAHGLPLPLGELFRVVEQRVEVIRRQDDSGGRYRPGQTPSAGFVGPGYRQGGIVPVF